MPLCVGAVVTTAGAEGEKGGGIASQGDVDGTADPVGTGARGQGRHGSKGNLRIMYMIHVTMCIAMCIRIHCLHIYA